MQKTKDGRMMDVAGEYTLYSPPIPDRSAFLNGHVTKKSAQKFEHTILPTLDEWDEWPAYKQKELEDQEWHRRENGVWFFNDGVPTYLTGQNYFYLNYHRYGDMKPEYREAHRRVFWVWQHCLEAPNCLGLYMHTRRRFGKTSIAASIALEAVTRIRHFRVGIQSKTEDDAKALFLNEIIKPFEALQQAPWFMPQTAGTTRPQSELILDTPATGKKDKKARAAAARLVGLKSKVDWREGTVTAYDSQGLGLFLNDEVGKDQKYDPFARHSVVSKQFDPSGEVIGKEFATTTSDENDDDSVGKCKEFWTKSDQTKLLDEFSRTESGLWRYFVPDKEGWMVDEYGRDTFRGLQDLDRRRAEVSANPISLLRRKRAYPRTVEEALLPSVKADCVVNAEHVGHVLSWIATQEKAPYRRYDLEWVDPDTRTRVRAMENNTSGRFYFSWIPPDSWLNQVQREGELKTTHGLMTKWKPLNTHRFGSGADPADHRDPEKLSGASLTALSGFYKFDEDMEAKVDLPGYWPSHSMIMEYAERMADPDTYFEDVVKYIHFMGCSVFPETNRPGLANYLRARGYQLFISNRPASTQTEHNKNQKNAGAASSTLMIGRYTEEWVRYVSQYVGSEISKNSRGEVGINDEGVPYDPRRMPFERTLNQILQFDPNKTTKFDLAVSAGFALCDINRYQPFKAPDAATDGLKLTDFNPSNFFRR